MTRDWVAESLRIACALMSPEAREALEQAVRGPAPTQPETPAAALARRWAAMGTDEVPEEETEPWE